MGATQAAVDATIALADEPTPFLSPTTAQEASSPLAEDREHLQMLIGYFEESEDMSTRARELAERDRDYHDNFDDSQWTDKQKEEMRRRGQPLLTSNYIKRKVATLAGVEQRMRSDPKAFPRTPQIDEHRASAATDALRYIGDSNHFNQIRSAAYEEILIEGFCGADVVAEKKKDGSYAVKIKRVPWDRLFYDPHSCEPDFSDAEYRGIVIWKNARRDDPGPLGETIRQSGSDTYSDRPKTHWVDSKRTRVRVVQIHYRHEGVWMVATFTKAGYLPNGEPQPSPYLDDDGEPTYSLQMQSCYVDRENNRFGAVRDWISTQLEINKRRSKAVHQINSRQTFGNAVAIADVDEAKAQLAMPDGHIAINAGAQWMQDFGVIPTNDMSAGNLQLLQLAISEMQASGPNAAMAGKAAGQQSGRALEAQVQAGAVEIEPHNDKLRTFTRNVYAAAWMRARQFWTGETWVRVTDDERNVKFVGLNKRVTLEERLQQMPEDRRAAEMQRLGIRPGDPRLQEVVEIINKTSGLHVDIEIEEGPDISALQGEQFETLAGLAEKGLPIPPDAIIEASSLRNKQQLLKRMRGEDEENPSPAQQQMQQQMAQLQQVAQQLADKLKAAEQALADKQAENAIKAREVGVKETQAQTQARQASALAPPDAAARTEIHKAMIAGATDIVVEQIKAMHQQAAAQQAAAAAAAAPDAAAEIPAAPQPDVAAMMADAMALLSQTLAATMQPQPPLEIIHERDPDTGLIVRSVEAPAAPQQEEA